MKVADLVIAGASILSGVKTLVEGLGEISTAAKQAKNQFKSDGTAPVANRHEVGTSINQRIRYIREMIDAGYKDPRIRSFAVKVVSSRCARCPACGAKNVLTAAAGGVKANHGQVRAKVGDDGTWTCGKCGKASPMAQTAWCTAERDYRREVESVFDAVRANVRYVRDPINLDTYQHPKRTLSWGAADCDDYTIALASMLKSIGYPVKLRVIETRDPRTGRRAGSWTHILLLCGLPPKGPEGWLPLDASVNKPAGWYPPKPMIYRVRDFSA